MNPIVTIKGIREGLLIILGDGIWVELRELCWNILIPGRVFKGAHLAVDVGNCI
jgi:hypothetical protein